MVNRQEPSLQKMGTKISQKHFSPVQIKKNSMSTNVITGENDREVKRPSGN